MWQFWTSCRAVFQTALINHMLLAVASRGRIHYGEISEATEKIIRFKNATILSWKEKNCTFCDCKCHVTLSDSVFWKMKPHGRAISRTTHQVFRTVQLMCGGGTAGDEGLEHASHHHRLHILRYRLVVPRGEVVPKARLVWKQQWSGGDHG